MKPALCLLFIAILIMLTGIIYAGPSLDIRSGPVINNGYTGPINDPASAQGQWFFDPATGSVMSRTHEFYDNPSVIGEQGVLSINGVVTELIKAG